MTFAAQQRPQAAARPLTRQGGLILPPQPSDDGFQDRVIRCFEGFGGGIGFDGYVLGGGFYNTWLETNDAYRSQVVLSELALTTERAADAIKLCPNIDSFLQMGASGSLTAFYTKPYVFIQAIAAQRDIQRLDYRIADISQEAFNHNKTLIKDLGLPFAPMFVPGNFYSSLQNTHNVDGIYVPGITIDNPPFDALKYSPEAILHYQLSYFRRSLSKRGILAFSFANNTGVDSEGNSLKAFYDDPLIADYQATIFQRIKGELSPSGDFDPNNFSPICHQWHADKYVLTRHSSLSRPMHFGIGERTYDWKAGHTIYMSNNTRRPNAMYEKVAREAGYADCVIFEGKRTNTKSNVCLAVLINS
jgi:hypothetical protein